MEDTVRFKYVIIKLLIKKVLFIPATTRHEGFTDPQSQTETVLLTSTETYETDQHNRNMNNDIILSLLAQLHVGVEEKIRDQREKKRNVFSKLPVRIIYKTAFLTFS